MKLVKSTNLTPKQIADALEAAGLVSRPGVAGLGDPVSVYLGVSDAGKYRVEIEYAIEEAQP